MCEESKSNIRTVLTKESVGMALMHDITEIRQSEFKGRAFKKGYIITESDIEHLQRLGKERVFVLNINPDEVHEDEAAYVLAKALVGEGVKIDGEPEEGKINIIAIRDGLLKIKKDTLLSFNTLGEVMCASLHNNSIVKKGQIVAGTRAIPLVVKRKTVEEAVNIVEKIKNPPQSPDYNLRGQAPFAKGREKEIPSMLIGEISQKYPPLTKGGEGGFSSGVIEVKELRKAKVGVVITGNEVYYGKVKDTFLPVIRQKIKEFRGEIVDIHFTPDDEGVIEDRLKDLLLAGADMLLCCGGMSVDPDDVTRFAIKNIGAVDISYGSAVLPGSMFLVAYINKKGGDSKNRASDDKDTSIRIPIIGIPACGMYHKITVFDLVMPRILAGETIGRAELAEMGHGGLCLNCKECIYPMCPFGK